MIKKLLGFFTGKKEVVEDKAAARSSSRPAVSAALADVPKDLQDVVGFVDYVVRALVDEPTAVTVELTTSNDAHVIMIKCQKSDIGKIIGKSGKTIMAIRQLVTGAASRLSKQVNVEVLD